MNLHLTSIRRGMHRPPARTHGAAPRKRALPLQLSPLFPLDVELAHFRERGLGRDPVASVKRLHVRSDGRGRAREGRYLKIDPINFPTSYAVFCPSDACLTSGGRSDPQ